MKKISNTQKEKFYSTGHTLPKCINEGCNNNVSIRNWGNWSFKSECSRCQSARKKGILIQGIIRHKKNYCENIDGHLGFRCPVQKKENWIGFESALDLDHIDGNNNNNQTENVKTYCKMCHTKKGIEQGDCSNKKSSGRKFNE